MRALHVPPLQTSGAQHSSLVVHIPHIPLWQAWLPHSSQVAQPPPPVPPVPPPSPPGQRSPAKIDPNASVSLSHSTVALPAQISAPMISIDCTFSVCVPPM